MDRVMSLRGCAWVALMVAVVLLAAFPLVAFGDDGQADHGPIVSSVETHEVPVTSAVYVRSDHGGTFLEASYASHEYASSGSRREPLRRVAGRLRDAGAAIAHARPFRRVGALPFRIRSAIRGC